MLPLYVRARNYRTWRELELELPSGCVAIVGPNGAGKSSIVNLVDLCLFGPPSRSLADYLSTDAGETEMLLELVFDHRGSSYRVTRTYSAKGRGASKLELSEWKAGADIGADPADVHGWLPLTRDTQKATQELLEQTLGLTRQTLRASAFLGQGDGAAFTEADPRVRKQILAEILGLDIWERMRALVHADRLELERLREAGMGTRATLEVLVSGEDEAAAERGEAIARRARLREEATVDEEKFEATKRMIAEHERTAERLEGARRREGTERHALNVADASYNRARAEHAKAKADADEAAELAGADADAEKAQKARDVLARAWERHTQRELERARVTREITRFERDVEQFDGRRRYSEDLIRRTEEELERLRAADVHRETCQTCGQELATGEARERAEAARRQELADVEEELARRRDERARLDLEEAELTHSLTEVRTALEALGDPSPPSLHLNEAEIVLSAAQKRAARLAALAGAGEHVAAAGVAVVEAQRERDDAARRMDEAVAERKRIEAELAGVAFDELGRKAAELERRIAHARAAEREQDGIIARCDERLAEIAKRKDALAETKRELAKLSEDLATLTVLERAYGRDGVPSLIVEAVALPQIEQEASRILAELGGETASWRIELRTERALKSGEGVRDALDIVIVGPGGERMYETFSGGERTRLNLALRIALARLLAHRRGADVQMLVLDEPTDLDDDGYARLAAVLRELSGDFERVILISHHPAGLDAFDHTLEVWKDEDGVSHAGAAPVDRELVV